MAAIRRGGDLWPGFGGATRLNRDRDWARDAVDGRRTKGSGRRTKVGMTKEKKVIFTLFLVVEIYSFWILRSTISPLC